LSEGLASIIAQLERQKTGIDKALAALREVEGITPDVAAPVASESAEPINKRSEAQRARWAAKKAAEPATRKGGMTPEGKKRLIAALKKRWAAKKAAAGETAAPAKATRKGGMTDDGRKRLAEAMTRRWAVKRAAARKQARAQKMA
jgi:hypothetical protein